MPAIGEAFGVIRLGRFTLARPRLLTLDHREPQALEQFGREWLVSEDIDRELAHPQSLRFLERTLCQPTDLLHHKRGGRLSVRRVW